MASLRTGWTQFLKSPSISRALVLLAVFVFATSLWAQIESPRGFSRNDAARRPKPSTAPSGLGYPVEKDELAAWDISIAPDGQGLPAGNGSAVQGASIWAPRGCGDCHGPNGQEGPAPVLVDGPTARGRIRHFPFAPLIWDFIHRAMPYDRPGRLSNDEVYALTAYLLFRNGIIQDTDVMDAKSLARVQMPFRSEYMPEPPYKPGEPRNFKILPP